MHWYPRTWTTRGGGIVAALATGMIELSKASRLALLSTVLSLAVHRTQVTHAALVTPGRKTIVATADQDGRRFDVEVTASRLQ